MKSSFGVCRSLGLFSLLIGLASNGLVQEAKGVESSIFSLQPSSTPVPTGLISWWQGETNTNANDFMGLNNGILEGGVSFAPGEVGQAFDFTDTNQDVLVPASPSLNVANYSGFTLEAWINPADVTEANPIFGWYTTNGIAGVQFQTAVSGALYAAIEDTKGNTNQLGSADGVVTTNAFQHVALTFDKPSGVATIYYNGQIVSQETFTNIVPQASYNFYIGGQPLTNGEVASFFGEIDEAAIYDRALSSNEVASIYSAGNAGKSTSPVPPEILIQPVGQNVAEGGTVDFSVLADGTGPLKYQWTLNGKNLTGATNSSLGLDNVHPAQAGNSAQAGTYAVKVTSPYGTNVSANAVLAVNAGTIIAYKYSGMEYVVTTNMVNAYATNQFATLYTGMMYFEPATTNITIVDWGNMDRKKSYWVYTFTPSVFFTVPGTNVNDSYTVFGDTSATYDSNGQVHFNSDIARGFNVKLVIGAKTTYEFPNTFITEVTHANPDTQTGKMLLREASYTFTYNAAVTQNANNTGRTVTDLLNTVLANLNSQGYRPAQ